MLFEQANMPFREESSLISRRQTFFPSLSLSRVADAKLWRPSSIIVARSWIILREATFGDFSIQIICGFSLFSFPLFLERVSTPRNLFPRRNWKNPSSNDKGEGSKFKKTLKEAFSHNYSAHSPPSLTRDLNAIVKHSCQELWCSNEARVLRWELSIDEKSLSW